MLYRQQQYERRARVDAANIHCVRKILAQPVHVNVMHDNCECSVDDVGKFRFMRSNTDEVVSLQVLKSQIRRLR